MTVPDRMWEFLAQATTRPTSQPVSPMAWLLTNPMILLIAMLGVFYLMIWRGQSKEKKKKQDMLSAIGKNDRVMTIGGIIGTVVTVKEDEVVVKVDESTNTKMTFTRRAIQKVFGPGESADQ